jgi:putative ABC transport system ATP-binding protein
MNSKEAPLIECKDVTKTYKMGNVTVEAARGIDLKIFKKDFLAIVGPSGSGKSTLMHLIGALDTPSGGKVLIDGHDLREMADLQRTRLRGSTIGFVFQTFNLINHMTIVDNVSLVMRFGADTSNRRQRAEELLIRVGLKDRLKHKPQELSGGERQRVAIARALANGPKILLADEPTGNLDSKTSRNIMELLKDQNKNGLTVVIVTHDTELAQEAKRIVRIRDGRIERMDVGNQGQTICK